ncbi:MAG: ribonuclease catalytic domain-containing protein, partial [Gemmatimonadota bacterium]
MLDRGFLPDFSPAATAAAREMSPATAQGDPSIRDLRALLWASIDNDDSRDLDQLSCAEPLADGAVKVLVAIADVDALVTIGSPVDGHAETNTTSVYTAAEIFPMLPEVLSTDRTSLAAAQERLAMVIELVVAADGTISASDIYRAVVVNRAKLAYNSVAAWLEGEAAAPAPLAAVPGMDEQLRLQDRVAQAMRAVRRQNGALSLDTAEARAVFDGEVLAELVPDEGNRAKQIIEDLMIAANGVSARFLEGHKLPSLRRVLRVPKRWDRIVELAAELGAQLPADPDAGALDEFLRARRAAEPDGFADLSLSVVKLLGSGEYMLELPGEEAMGHFGLAVQDYTHSTAPN